MALLPAVALSLLILGADVPRRKTRAGRAACALLKALHAHAAGIDCTRPWGR